MNKIQVVYSSKATVDVDDVELEELLKTSVRNNAEQQVSGMLLYTKGSFLQLLEGEAPAVDALLKRIEGDPRHHDIQVHIRTSIKEREFKNWSMGYRRLNERDARAMMSFAPFFEDGFDAAKFCDQPGIALDILRTLAAQLEET